MARPKKVEETEEVIVEDNTGNNDNVEPKTEESCPAEKEKEKEKSSDNSEIMKQLLQEVERLKGQIAEIQTEPRATQYRHESEVKFGSSVSKNIPKSDKLDKPTTFITIGRGYVMSCYNKDGSEVLAPYGQPILFKWRNSDKRGQGGEEVAIHYSTYSTWSKKECEFIKESPYFGHLIFDSVSKMSKVNPNLVSAIEQATNYVANMTQDQMFAIANQYHLDVDMSIKELKDKVVAIKVQGILDQDNSVYESVLARSGFEKEPAL